MKTQMILFELFNLPSVTFAIIYSKIWIKNIHIYMISVLYNKVVKLTVYAT